MSNTLEISTRPIEARDQAILWEAAYHAIHVPAGEPPASRDLLRDPAIARYAESWGREGDVGVFALNDSHVIGGAWLRLWRGDNRGYGYVDDDTPELSISVWPDFRGRGVGTRMLQDLYRVADQRFPKTSLSVSIGNPAERLYCRFGFEVIENTGTALTMVRRKPRRT